MAPPFLNLIPVFLGLMVLAPAARAAEPAGIAEAEAIRKPVLAEREAALKDWRFTQGALEVRFDQGAAGYLLVKGRPAGIYVRGTGRFRYLAADAATRPVMQFNLAENARVKAREENGTMVLGEPVTEAVFWFAGRDVPALTETGPTTLAKDYEATAATFAQREAVEYAGALEDLHRLPLSQLAAYKALNNAGGDLVTVEMVGAAERYVYTHDPVVARTESLFIQRAMYQVGRVQTLPVAETPLGWKRMAPPDPDFRVTHLALDLVASRGVQATLKVVETVQVLKPSLRALTFRLRNLRLLQDSMERLSTEEVRVKHVRGGDGKDLAFDVRGGYLLADLGRTVRNGETFKVDFELEGPILDNESSGEFQYWRLKPGDHWFPEAELAGQGYTVEATVAVEKPFVPIISARTLARTETATHNVVKGSLDKPTVWFSVAAGKYKPLELVRNNRTVRAWCYGGVPSTAEQLLKTAHGILDFYDGLLGGVPFDEINLVEVPYLGFGQAPAGMIWLTREAFNPTADLETRYMASYGATGGWANRMIAHELAHQYWGHRVKIYSQSDNWLSEAFAEYTSALAIRAMRKKGPGVYDAILVEWRDRVAKICNLGTIPTTYLMQPHFADKQGDVLSGTYPQALLYAKGAYLLACLHKEVGEEAFLRFLRVYQKRFAWYPPSIGQDVTDLLKATTGRDFSAWMADNLWGTSLPPVPK